jgi:hypothetical protein
MRLPPRQRWGATLARRWRRIEEAAAGTSTKPFQHTAREEIDADAFHVDRNHSDRMKCVE